jgi:hypothetical protein
MLPQEMAPSYQLFFGDNNACASASGRATRTNPEQSRRELRSTGCDPNTTGPRYDEPAFRPLGHAARAIESLADLHPATGADQGKRT